MDKKYELTNITMDYKGRKLHRIKALKDFGYIKKGQLGGWIENENNLSQFDNSWIYDEGKVYDDGIVFDNGQVYEYGEVFDNGAVYENGRVYKYGQIYGCGEVYGHGKVFENGQVYEDGEVYGHGQVYGTGEVYGYGRVFGNGKVCKELINTKISIPYKAIIQIQCENRIVNALLTEDDKIVFNVGCQDNISKETFIDRIYNTDGGLEVNPHRREYLDVIDYMESYLLNKKGETK